MSTNQPRDDHGRYASSGTPNDASGRHPVIPHNGAQSVGTHLPADDFTINPRTGKAPGGGYQVGGAGKYLGGWTDPATGKRYVEKSTNVKGEALARSLGRRRNQISIYDHKSGRTISTGGTGA